MEKETNPTLTQEESKLLLPHDFDGIRELDNDPPRWFMYLFYITVFFGVIYIFHFHVFKQGALQDEEYKAEMAMAAALKGPVAEVELLAFTDELNLTKGKELYQQKICYSCHGNLGEGNTIGPNLTDDYWIHGGAIENVYEMIKYGVPAKGMPPFKDQATEEQLLQMASFVVSLAGTNPPNAREPQGELYVE
jgi:cytochrome c oxidase cbb3-type subunit 3